MSGEDVCWMSATGLLEAYRKEELSPVEVTEAVLGRIDDVNPKINAVVTVVPEIALSAARDAEKAYADGSAGPLAGVPVTVKDLIMTRGIRTTWGSRLYEDHVPEEDAIVVERLKDAGAVVLGKTNTPELGLIAVTDNLVFGPARNPWNTRKTTGGSSGGAAGAAAAGFGPLHLGNDGGGSIRIPSSLCGVYGIKPQHGRIPSYPHIVHGWETMSCEGPITRTVADAALMLDVMAGPHPYDRFSLPESGVNYIECLKGGVKGLKVAYSADMSVGAVDPEVAGMAGKAARVFEELGCEVVEDDPGIPFMAEDLTIMVIVETVAAVEDRIDEVREKMYPLYLPFLDIADAFTARQYAKVFFHREDMWEKMSRFFERYDLLLTPTVSCAAFDIREGGMMGPDSVAGVEASPASWIGFTFPLNFTGQPAATVPCGFNSEGLPVGLQIIGNRYDEPTVLRASAAFEEARPWRDRHPEL